MKTLSRIFHTCCGAYLGFGFSVIFLAFSIDGRDCAISTRPFHCAVAAAHGLLLGSLIGRTGQRTRQERFSPLTNHIIDNLFGYVLYIYGGVWCLVEPFVHASWDRLFFWPWLIAVGCGALLGLDRRATIGTHADTSYIPLLRLGMCLNVLSLLGVYTLYLIIVRPEWLFATRQNNGPLSVDLTLGWHGVALLGALTVSLGRAWFVRPSAKCLPPPVDAGPFRTNAAPTLA